MKRPETQVRDLWMAVRYESGDRVVSLSAAYGIGRERVYQILREQRVEFRSRGPVPRLDRGALVRLRWARALADVVPAERLRRVFDLPSALLRPRGEHHWYPVYSYGKAQRIVALWNDGFGFPQLRRHLGVTTSFIQQSLGRARAYGLEVRKGQTNRVYKTYDDGQAYASSVMRQTEQCRRRRTARG